MAVLFETAVVGRSPNGDLLIALFDGSMSAGRQGCVAILTCRPETGRALVEALGSTLNPEPE